VSGNPKVACAFFALLLFGLVTPFFISAPKKRGRPRSDYDADVITFDDDGADAPSPNWRDRTYGNVPLSQQEAQRAASPRAAPAPRTFGNVPLSQQKKAHAD